MECQFYLRKFQSEFGTTQREMQGKQLNFFLSQNSFMSPREKQRDTKRDREGENERAYKPVCWESEQL